MLIYFIQFLVISAFLGCGVDSYKPHLLGSRKCSWGPAYWCNNITNAHQCDAGKHCVENVWKNMAVADDNDDICKVCKDMVKQARDQLESNETMDEIKQVFEGSCNILIPIKVIAKECCDMADTYVPELVEMLASEMNPDVICSVAGLCNSERIDKMITEYKKTGELEKKSQCKECKKFLKKSHTDMEATPNSIIVEHMFAMCGELGGQGDACKLAVISNFYRIKEFFVNLLGSEEGCLFFGMCGRGVTQSSTTIDMTVKDDLECQFCEKMIQHWKDSMVSNTTEEEFKTVLESLCTKLGKEADECKDLVEQYYVAVYDYLMHTIKPKEICTELGVCQPARFSIRRKDVWSMVPSSGLGDFNRLLKSFHGELAGTDEGNALRLTKKEETVSASKITRPVTVGEFSDSLPKKVKQELMVPATKVDTVKSPSTVCILCEYVVHDLQTYLQDKKTAAQIKADLEKVCDLMPKTISAECDNFVETYGNLIIAMIIQDVDPAKICTKLQLCSSAVVLKVDLHSVNKASCYLCELVLKELEKKIINPNETREVIDEVLKVVCTYLPSSVSTKCTEFVNEFEEVIIDALLADLTNSEICQLLGLCILTRGTHRPYDMLHDEMVNNEPMPDDAELIVSSDLLENHSPFMLNGQLSAQAADARNPSPFMMNGLLSAQAADVKASPQLSGFAGTVNNAEACAVCEYAMGELSTILDDKATRKEIEDAVKSVCTYLPATVQDECKQMITEYGDAIIQLIDQFAKDPKECCTELGLCTAATAKSVASPPVKVAIVSKCDVCKVMVTYLDELIEDHTVLSQITSAVKKVCYIVPKPYFKKCKTIITVYGGDILELLKVLGTPQGICDEIKLCREQKPEEVHLLGGAKCTWGPDYWCQSKQHAKACQATKHCTEKVWKN